MDKRYFNLSSAVDGGVVVWTVFSRENELHHEGGPGDECVAEHNIGADENPVRVFGNHRRTQVVSTRVSEQAADLLVNFNGNAVAG